MEIEELLVAIGVDTSQAAKINEVVVALATAATKIATEANKINENLDDIGDQASDDLDDASRRADEVGGSLGRLKLLALGIGAVVGMATAKVLGFIDASLAGAKELAQEKGLLFDISKKELAQADEYQEAMKKTGLSIESIKTKIALNLVPQLTKATQGFNDWLGANKELITEGLTQVIQWGAKIIQMVVNSIKAVSKLVESTVGWKGAILGIITILAVLKKSMIMAFIANPITWVIAGIVGLMLLLDDLMVYLEGGDSLFGDFWGPAIEWVKSVIAWWNKFYAENKVIFDALEATFKKAFDAMMTIFGGVISYLFNALKFLVGLFTGDTEMMSEAWDGMVNSIMQIWDGLSEYLSAFFALWDIMWTIAGKVVSNVWEAIKKGANKAFDWIKKKAKAFSSSISEAFKPIIDFVLSPFKAGFNLVKKLYDTFTNDTTSWTEKLDIAFTAIKDFLFAPFQAGWDLVKGLFNISDADAKKFVDDIGKAFKGVTDLIKKPFKAAFDIVKSQFDWLLGGIIGGLEEIGVLDAKKEEKPTELTEDEQKALNDKMSAVTSGINDEMSKFSGKLIDTIQSLAFFPENANAVMANAQANRNISVQIGDTTIHQSIASSDPQKAASLSSDAYSKANRLTYQNLMSAISPN